MKDKPSEGCIDLDFRDKDDDGQGRRKWRFNKKKRNLKRR